jgi:hypothetical protein
LIDRSQADEELTYLVNLFIGQGATSSSSNSSYIQVYGGALVAPFLTLFVSWSLGFDIILSPAAGAGGNFQLVAAAPNLFGGSLVASFPWLGRVCLDGNITGLYGVWNLFEADDAETIIWGSGTLNIQGQSRVYYASPAASTFLVPTITINSQTNAVAFDVTTGLWTILIPITTANLDLAISGGGFGGTAINPLGGATLTNQTTV